MKPIRAALDVDAEEEPKRTHVLDRELRLEACDDGLE